MDKEAIRKELDELNGSLDSYEKKANRVLENMGQLEEESNKGVGKDESLKGLWPQLMEPVRDMKMQLNNIKVEREAIKTIKAELEKNG